VSLHGGGVERISESANAGMVSLKLFAPFWHSVRARRAVASAGSERGSISVLRGSKSRCPLESSSAIVLTMHLTFDAHVDGQPKPVQMRLGSENDLEKVRRWRSPARLRANPHVRDALEYAKLPSK
jgi:hypothetical protein